MGGHRAVDEQLVQKSLVAAGQEPVATPVLLPAIGPNKGGHKVLEVQVVQDCSDPNQLEQFCSSFSVQARQQVPTPRYLAFSVRSLLGDTRSSQVPEESLELF
jgi:hypothetical protein